MEAFKRSREEHKELRNNPRDPRPTSIANPSRFTDSQRASQDTRSRYGPAVNRQQGAHRHKHPPPQRASTQKTSVQAVSQEETIPGFITENPDIRYRGPVAWPVVDREVRNPQREESELQQVRRERRAGPPEEIMQAPPNFPPIPVEFAEAIPRALSPKATSCRAERGKI